MVSLCLTNPRLNGMAHKKEVTEATTQDGKWQEETERVKRDNSNFVPNILQHDRAPRRGNIGQSHKNKGDVDKPSKVPLAGQNAENTQAYFSNSVIGDKRESMLKTLQAMGNLPRRNSRNRILPSTQYNTHVTDARTVPYRVHKWRPKSGRKQSLHTNTEHVIEDLESTVVDYKRRTLHDRGKENYLPPINTSNNVKRATRNYKKLATVLEDKEGQFCFCSRTRFAGAAKHDDDLIKRLRKNMQQIARVDTRLPTDTEDKFNVSEFSSPEIKFGEGHGEFMNREHRIAKWKKKNGKRRRIQLPPIRQKLRRKKVFASDNSRESTTDKQPPDTRFNTRLVDKNTTKVSYQTSVENLRRKTSADTDVFDSVVMDSQGLSTVAEVPKADSPSNKKTPSTVTMHSPATARNISKDGDTPESDASNAIKQRRLRRTRTSRTLISKSDGRGSPQIYRYIKPSRDSLMWKWHVAAKLTIWVARLCRGHRVLVDDQYNIKNGSDVGSEWTAEAAKREVLFDVTDYKMKNQLRLSDTTRRILTLPSNKRTDKEINLVQAALRNIKAVSDHSTAVQRQIGRRGYFVGFDAKRVVVREGRLPLNYYILLAGSAVVIKEDESGNTNPVQFLKRGDVFGEHEILEDENWRWSIATSGYSEFLALDRETYREIFITGGGGGLLTDPDRGKFLRSVSLLNQWPTELLNENPNRCLFRYFKRGALLVKDDFNTEWIYVVKSGSCSVMKMLLVEKNLSKAKVLQRAKEEQKFKPDSNLSPRLVEKSAIVTEDDHLKALQGKEEEERMKANDASVFQQLEMSMVLKELNADVMGLSTSPQANMDELDHQTELPLSSSRSEIKHKVNNFPAELQQNIEPPIGISKYMQENGTNGFRLSRHSDRHPPRTPSPMKAAYLRTGVTPVPSRMSMHTTGEKQQQEALNVTSLNASLISAEEELKKNNGATSFSANTDEAQKEMDLNKYFESTLSPALTTKSVTQRNLFQPTHINVRKLTKGDVFGVGSTLYNDQPSLSLVSNGAECLMLNKRFYLENANEECIRGLRETQYPYPTDEELLEQHWRLMTWRAYQSETIDEVLERQNQMRQHARTQSFI